jgi:hypothetical protein
MRDQRIRVPVAVEGYSVALALPAVVSQRDIAEDHQWSSFVAE